eukprot:TRINITY_DN4071_c1_g1_i2.p1 TRINITY_DN4071_c1_g1~~TRINITY_DN4071_c1_g1_i2.p1  ORF type:complete len:447 (+),score=107.28 TRINITY_DN4071_c1_g1_i2:167-1507(+)
MPDWASSLGNHTPRRQSGPRRCWRPTETPYEAPEPRRNGGAPAGRRRRASPEERVSYYAPTAAEGRRRRPGAAETTPASRSEGSGGARAGVQRGPRRIFPCSPDAVEAVDILVPPSASPPDPPRPRAVFGRNKAREERGVSPPAPSPALVSFAHNPQCSEGVQRTELPLPEDTAAPRRHPGPQHPAVRLVRRGVGMVGHGRHAPLPRAGGAEPWYVRLADPAAGGNADRYRRFARGGAMPAPALEEDVAVTSPFASPAVSPAKAPQPAAAAAAAGMTVAALPDDALVRVFSWLRIGELGRCAAVSRRWGWLGADDSLWGWVLADPQLTASVRHLSKADVPHDAPAKARCCILLRHYELACGRRYRPPYLPAPVAKAGRDRRAAVLSPTARLQATRIEQAARYLQQCKAEHALLQKRVQAAQEALRVDEALATEVLDTPFPAFAGDD